MKKNLFALIFLISPIQSGLAQDNHSDQAYERKVYNIYLKHYKDPTPHSEWDRLVQSLPAEHKLKSKDNMWDLSGSFFKNSLYWSKMWVANPQVENPHLIYKGNSLKLSSKILAAVNTSKHSVGIDLQFPGLEIPKNKWARGALRESEIPSSLPVPLIFQQSNSEINISQMKRTKIRTNIIVPSYMTGKAPTAEGEVIGKEGYGDSISLNGDHLIVSVNSDAVIGSVYTVFENKGKIGDLLQIFSGLTEDEIVIKGKIKILSSIQGTRFFTAVAVDVLDKIAPGDSLLRGAPPVYSFSREGNMGSASGQIIGSNNRNQSLLSLGSIVYLDKGRINGIQPGQIFYIRGKGGQGFSQKYKYENPLLGKMKIIHGAETTATGIIIESKNPIHIGDIFSSDSDKVDDLGKSMEYEKIPADEDLEDGKELLIDVEEVEEMEEPVQEPEEKEEELEDFEVVGEEEEGLVKEEAEEQSLEMDFEDEEPVEGLEEEGFEEIEELTEEDFEVDSDSEASEDDKLEEDFDENLEDKEAEDNELEEFEEIDIL